MDILVFIGLLLFALSLWIGNQVHGDPHKQKKAYAVALWMFFGAAFLWWLSSNF